MASKHFIILGALAMVVGVLVIFGYVAGSTNAAAITDMPITAQPDDGARVESVKRLQVHLDEMRRENNAQMQGLAEKLSAVKESVVQLQGAIATINRMTRLTPAPPSPPSAPPTPQPRVAGAPLAIRHIRAVEKTEQELEVLIDGNFDKAVHIDDSKSDAMVYLDFTFANKVPFRKIVLHTAKERHTHTYRNLTIYLMLDDEVVFESPRLDWGPYQNAAEDPSYFNNEEVRAVVPADSRLPANRVRITECNPARKVLHLSEVVFYVDSDTVPTPTLFRGKRRVAWTTATPTPEVLKFAKKACSAREGKRVSMYTPSKDIKDDKQVTNGVVAVDKKFDCVIVAALFGTVEKTLKKIVPQEHECDRIMFSDRTDLAGQESTTGWRVVNTPFHEYHAETKQFMGSHPEDVFLKAKFYKQQAHRLVPSHVKYLIWVDGTITVYDKRTTATIIKSLQTDASIGTMAHPSPTVMHEVTASIPKYHRGFDTFDYITQEYLRGMGEGFCERFWDNETAARPSRELVERVVSVGLARDRCLPKYRNYHTLMPLASAMVDAVTVGNYTDNCKPMGTGVANKEDLKDVLSAPLDQGLTMGLTCVVSYDLRHRVVRDFLDDWWRTTFWHWQDQVTFPIMAWKFGILPKYLNNLLKDKDGKDFWEKLPHFQ